MPLACITTRLLPHTSTCSLTHLVSTEEHYENKFGIVKLNLPFLPFPVNVVAAELGKCKSCQSEKRTRVQCRVHLCHEGFPAENSVDGATLNVLIQIPMLPIQKDQIYVLVMKQLEWETIEKLQLPQPISPNFKKNKCRDHNHKRTKCGADCLGLPCTTRFGVLYTMDEIQQKDMWLEGPYCSCDVSKSNLMAGSSPMILEEPQSQNVLVVVRDGFEPELHWIHAKLKN